MLFNTLQRKFKRSIQIVPVKSCTKCNFWRWSHLQILLESCTMAKDMLFWRAITCHLGFQIFCFKTFIFVSLLNLESFNELFGQSISSYKQIQKFGTTFKKLLRIKKYIIRGIRRKLAKSPAKKSSVIS